MVTCDPPDTILHGTYTLNSPTGVHDYNSTVSYTCDYGYEVTSGDANKICNEYGLWTGITPNCTSKIKTSTRTKLLRFCNNQYVYCLFLNPCTVLIFLRMKKYLLWTSHLYMYKYASIRSKNIFFLIISNDVAIMYTNKIYSHVLWEMSHCILVHSYQKGVSMEVFGVQ